MCTLTLISHLNALVSLEIVSWHFCFEREKEKKRSEGTDTPAFGH